MKNGIADLRNHLFEALEGLKDKDNPLDVDRALAISTVAGKIIDSARVEVDMVKALDHAGVQITSAPSGFMQIEGPKK